jgi:hypothetical protein
VAVPIVATAIALIGINVGLAVLIVAAIGVPTIAPPELGAVSLVIGIAAAAWAVRLWQSYLRARRDFLR